MVVPVTHPPRQLSLPGAVPGADPDEAGLGDAALHRTTFVVLDLETTGLSPERAAILEIGAVRVRGGVVEAEFDELIDPGRPIDPRITRLTGIGDADVAGRPQIGTVLPRFLDFARGATWVAHNAPFDLGFLRANAAELGLAWPAPPVVDTLRLARDLIDRGEVGSYRLGALAAHVGAAHRPSHRALADARATVAVLHHLIERLAGHEVTTAEQLRRFRPEVDPRLRAKRSLIDGVGHGPGVYLFRGPGGDPLYIGTAADLRRRLTQYFTGADPRRRITEMVLLAESVETVACAHALDAEVREARMLAALRPPYNRQRTEPGRGWHLAAAAGRPAVRRGAGGAGSIGPFRTRSAAEAARDLLFGHPGSPVAGLAGPAGRAPDFAEVAADLAEGGGARLGALVARIGALAEAGRYRRAAHERDILAELIEAVARRQRLGALAAVPQLQAARPAEGGGWELAVIRHGRLAAAGRCPRGGDAARVSRLLTDSADTVAPGEGPLHGANPHELTVLHDWLLRPEVRIGPVTGVWAGRVDGAGRWRDWAARAAGAAREARESDRGAGRR